MQNTRKDLESTSCARHVVEGQDEPEDEEAAVEIHFLRSIWRGHIGPMYHKGRTHLVLIAIFAWTSLLAADGYPLPPVQCNSHGCNIEDAYGLRPDRIPCKAASVVYPKTEHEILKAVADAVKEKQKIKVGTATSHSVPKLNCPSGQHGVIVSTRDYASIVSINISAMTVTAQSGIRLRQLIDDIAAKNLALPYSPYWESLTLGGMTAAGVHGSGLSGKGSALSEHIIGMSLVVPAIAEEGYAKIVTLRDGCDDLKAARTHLGVLGFVSEVTLQLEPLFKRKVTKLLTSDAGVEDKIYEIPPSNQFGDVQWFPSQHKVLYRLDNRVPVSTPGNAVNKYNFYQPIPGWLLEASRQIDEADEASRNATDICVRAQSAVASYPLGEGFQNNGSNFVGYPVIGFQNLIQAAGGCENVADPGANKSLGLYCAWETQRIKGNLGFSIGMHVPLRSIKKFILDVKSLRNLNPQSLCRIDVTQGILMRFVKKTENQTYLGYMEDVVEVGFSFYRADDGKTPRLFMDDLDELVQLTYKYGATPHWGKNRNSDFEGIHKRYPELDKFLAVKEKIDPKGLFSSEWSDAILGVSKKGPSIFKPYCAFEGLCTCKKDEHCAPRMNYFCRPGKIYKSARVCRYEASSS